MIVARFQGVYLDKTLKPTKVNTFSMVTENGVCVQQRASAPEFVVLDQYFLTAGSAESLVQPISPLADISGKKMLRVLPAFG